MDNTYSAKNSFQTQSLVDFTYLVKNPKQWIFSKMLISTTTPARSSFRLGNRKHTGGSVTNFPDFNLKEV